MMSDQDSQVLISGGVEEADEYRPKVRSAVDVEDSSNDEQVVDPLPVDPSPAGVPYAQTDGIVEIGGNYAAADYSENDNILLEADTEIRDSMGSLNFRDLMACDARQCRNLATVVILFIVNLLNYMDRFTIAGVLDKVQDYFGIGEASAGLLQTVFICTFMIFAPIFGYCGDRFSRKLIMIIGLVIWTAAVLLSSFVGRNYFWLFAICRGVVGIGEASYTTVAPTLIADLFDKDSRSRMLMLFYFAIPVGSGLGFVVGGNVAKLLGAWQWGVRVTPIFGAMCILLIVFVLKEPRRGQAQASVVAESSASWLDDLRQLVRNRTYVWSTMGFTCVAFVAGSLSWWAPSFVIKAQELYALNVDSARINLIFGIITCSAGFLGVTVGATVSQIWRRRNPRADALVCAIGMLACTPFLFGALVMMQYSMPVAWLMVFSAETMCFLNWSVNADILMYVIIPSRRATASAFQILVSHLLGDATSPYIIGQVAEALQGSSNSAYDQFVSLQYAMFIGTFACVLGGFFFLGTAWFVESDKKTAEMIMKGQIDEKGHLIISSTNASRNVHGHDPSNFVPPADLDGVQPPYTDSDIPSTGFSESASSLIHRDPTDDASNLI